MAITLMGGPCANGIISDVTGPCVRSREGLEASPSIPANGRNPLSPFGAGPRHMTHTVYGRAFIPFRERGSAFRAPQLV
jgi:hypothetical protein